MVKLEIICFSLVLMNLLQLLALLALLSVFKGVKKQLGEFYDDANYHMAEYWNYWRNK